MTRYYLLTVEGDVEPDLEGPYASDELRLARAHFKREEGFEGGLFRLDLTEGGDDWPEEPAEIEVDCFAGSELPAEGDA